MSHRGADDDWFLNALAAPLALAEDWVLWRAFCLRGTGFPLSMLEGLVNEAPEAELETLLHSEAALDECLAEAHRFCRESLPRRNAAEDKQRQKALALLRRRQAPDVLSQSVTGAALGARLETLLNTVAQQQTAFAATLASVDREGHERVRAITRDPRFREAVAWQNREFQRVAHSAYLDSEEIDHKARRRRRNLVKYIQRYTTKNESIGYFGPFGWAAFSAGPARLTAGASFLSRRVVHYEYWAIDALLRQLSADDAFMLRLAPVLSPRVRLAGDHLVTPFGTAELAAAQRDFLRACDGTRSAAGLCEQALADAQSGLNSRSDFLVLMRQLAAAETIVWAPPVPAVLHPERFLHDALDAIDDASERERIGAPFYTLEKARRAISEASSSSARIEALERFDTIFESTTGLSARRNEGVAYSGRSPLFEDCVRDVNVTIPDHVAHEIAPALSLVMRSARWFGAQLTSQYMELVDAHVNALQARFGVVALDQLWLNLQNDRLVLQALVDDVLEQLQERWHTVIPLDTDRAQETSVVQLDSAALRPTLVEQFDADTPGWPGARFNSPDLMLAAGSISDFDTDAWFAVLGEIHPLFNILTQEVTSNTSPAPAALLARAALERPEAELVPVKSRAGVGHRTSYDAAQANDLNVLFDESASAKPAHLQLRIGDLHCVRTDQGLRIRSHASTADYDAISFLAPQIRALGVGHFKLFGAQPYTPRVCIDRLVIQRESWRFALPGLPFNGKRDRHARYLEARRWARAIGLPRRCFYRLQGNRKPWYLDFLSPLLVELFTEQTRNTARAAAPDATLNISEMLPTPEQCWLQDAAGERYTSELRMAVRDGGLWPGDHEQDEHEQG